MMKLESTLDHLKSFLATLNYLFVPLSPPNYGNSLSIISTPLRYQKGIDEI